MYDANQKLINKGDKITISFQGKSFDVECLWTSIVDFTRVYQVKFEDGSVRALTAFELTSRVN